MNSSQSIPALKFHSTLWIALLLCLSGCSPKTTKDAGPLVAIAVMGDVPYGITSEEIENEKIILRQQISELNQDASIDFVVHVGDIKKGVPPCEPGVYQAASEILRKSNHPIFIIPGDNEWNDCANPDEAWTLWEKYFLRFDENWQNDLAATRQKKRPENFAIFRRGVLLIGINLVGGRVHDEEEWKTRIEDDRTWIEEQFRRYAQQASSAIIFAHANPGKLKYHVLTYNREEFRPLMEFLDQETSTIFPKPILLIHGDGHVWIEDNPFTTAGNRITRIQVTQGGHEDPLRVEVYDDPSDPFRLIRNLEEAVALDGE